MIEKDIVFSIECKKAIEYCFCCCPYCGKTIESCSCNIEGLTKNEVLPIKQNPEINMSEQSVKLHHDNTKDYDWERLEKWQIGRRNFP